MKRHKVKAFTLMEVTIAMLVSALVIAITYTSYSIIVKSYNFFTSKNNDVSAIATLDHLLIRDFEQGEIILKDSAGISMKMKDRTVKYEFNPLYIVRTAGRNDTFKVQMQGLTMGFNGVPVDEPGSGDEQNRLDELSFSVSYQQQIIPFHLKKTYSSENLINRNPDALN